MSTTDTTDVKQLTLQEIFTKVVLHARKQRAKAMSADENMCFYRGLDGLQCFAGCLIEDEYYSPEFEGETAIGDMVVDALTKSGVSAGLAIVASSSRNCLIADLQRIHDGNRIDQWERRFRERAAEYDLVVPEPTDEFPMLPE